MKFPTSRLDRSYYRDPAEAVEFGCSGCVHEWLVDIKGGVSVPVCAARGRTYGRRCAEFRKKGE